MQRDASFWKDVYQRAIPYTVKLISINRKLAVISLVLGIIAVPFLLLVSLLLIVISVFFYLAYRKGFNNFPIVQIGTVITKQTEEAVYYPDENDNRIMENFVFRFITMSVSEAFYLTPAGKGKSAGKQEILQDKIKVNKSIYSSIEKGKEFALVVGNGNEIIGFVTAESSEIFDSPVYSSPPDKFMPNKRYAIEIIETINFNETKSTALSSE
jgi:hypothetical protein